MQQREVSLAARRVVIVAPNLHIAEELEPLLREHLAGAQITHLRNYPSPRELGGIFNPGTQYLCFLDVVSNRERAFEITAELTQPGLSVHIIGLLSDEDTDVILRCMRAGAADFLIQPFTGEQLHAAFGKLARIVPNASA